MSPSVDPAMEAGVERPITTEAAACRRLPRRAIPALIFGVLAGAIGIGFSRWSRPTLPPGAVPDRPAVIAHAGGAVNGVTYSNSREALDENYRLGQRWFEIDFSWTSDGELVALHDWEWAWPRRFIEVQGVAGLVQFRSARMRQGLHQLTLDDVIAWLAAHPDAMVITDIKTRNCDGLSLIHRRAGAIWSQIVPQIYHPDEYACAGSLGGAQLPIFTLYQSGLSDDDVVRFVVGHPVFAVTMPVDQVDDTDLAARLRAGGIFVYAHTVNDSSLLPALAGAGIGGVYSDVLTAAGNVNNRSGQRAELIAR